MRAIRHFFIVLFALFALSVCGAFHLLAGGPIGAGDKAGTLESGGRTRSYFVHLPQGYDGKSPLPVVFILHGATQSAASAERMSGMSDLADAHKFLAVYPTGTGRLPSWNSGACCSYAMRNNVEDMAFFNALLDKIERDYAIDPKRVYFTGISNGAMMSFRLACEMPDRVAAIAPVEGSQDTPCRPSSPVSVLVFHGTADRLVPYDGGSTPYQMGSKRSDTPVTDTVAFWAKRDGCSPTPQHKESGVLGTDAYSRCTDGTAVVLQTIVGGHHMWPGLRISGNDIPASNMIWDFFAKHPKP